VIRQTAAWANKNQTQSGAILAAMAKLDPSIVAKMSRVIYADSLTPAMIQPNIDLLAQFKVIDRFEAADMIYTSSRLRNNGEFGTSALSQLHFC
jgi:hypothetical protein